MINPDKAKRVFRGGAWNNPAHNVNAPYRASLAPVLPSSALGFRIACNGRKG